ncbi:HAMP domain-containing histidine kinase [Patescibacteria group bacterium]|nr:HAMP domain-containing histidine kinase [Patescibacteria group bacterium]
MFERTRLKLTAWYLLIIMLISISFSVAIYGVLAQELNRVERMQRLRQERLYSIEQRVQPRLVIDQEVLKESKNRLSVALVLINLAILVAAGVAGYFLAERTLRPIKDMVDEQSRFITDVSHELRTPLTSLKSEIEVNLRDKNLKIDDATKLLQSNLEEVNNLQYLSDNLIKLTQYQKKTRTNFEKVNLKEISENAQKKIVNLARRKDILIRNQIKSIVINGDKQSLLELFVIFLDNAIKYSSKGKTVVLTSKKTDHSVVINFKDTGLGIDENDIPRLFDRFFRVDGSRTKSEVRGYGLGLSIAKQIIEKHDGSIKVESELGKGTIFSVYFPSKESF